MTTPKDTTGERALPELTSRIAWFHIAEQHDKPHIQNDIATVLANHLKEIGNV